MLRSNKGTYTHIFSIFLYPSLSILLTHSLSYSPSITPTLSLLLFLYHMLSLIAYIYTHSQTLSYPCTSFHSPTSSLSNSPSHSHALHSLTPHIQGMIVKSQAIPAGLPTQFCAAFGAGFFMACTVAPFDMVRTLRQYVTLQYLSTWLCLEAS